MAKNLRDPNVGYDDHLARANLSPRAMQLFDNPPTVDEVNAATPGLNKAAQNTLRGFAPSSVPGIYKAVAPDGSVTYTDAPGGSFDQTPPLARTPGTRPYVNNALTSRGVMTPEGEMGTGTGNFSAASIPANGGSPYRYRLPNSDGVADAGTKAGLAPGTTAWFNANAAPTNPLASPEAAAEYAANKLANSQARRGEGRFNTTVYDPSGYAQTQAPSMVSPFGVGGMGGMNPLEAMKTVADINEKQAHARTEEGRAQTAEEKATSEEIDKLSSSESIQKRAEAAGTDPQTFAILLYSARHPDNQIAEANARKALAGHMTQQFNAHYNWPDRVANWFGGSAPEPLPEGNAPATPYEPGSAWGRPAIYGPWRTPEGKPVPAGTPGAVRNYVFTNSFYGRSGAELLKDPEIGPHAGRLMSSSRLRDIATKEAQAATRK